jgi:hypothetical protein
MSFKHMNRFHICSLIWNKDSSCCSVPGIYKTPLMLHLKCDNNILLSNLRSNKSGIWNITLYYINPVQYKCCFTAVNVSIYVVVSRCCNVFLVLQYFWWRARWSLTDMPNQAFYFVFRCSRLLLIFRWPGV